MPNSTANTPLEQRPHPTARTIHAHARSAPSAGSLYIHTPFCVHKCHYCDFYSIVDRQDRQPAFMRRLTRELRAIAPSAGPLRTIFIGGGTPTLLRPELWTDLLGTLHDGFTLTPDAEFTVECNPETATEELFGILRAGGVNRLSMGAQSFNPVHLKTLERWHDPASVPRAVELAREAGIRRLSLDLIFGVPGQTLGEWDADLRTALDLGVDHLSCYSLTYEPNTAMTARLNRGEFEPIDPDLDADMLEHTLRTLRAHGMDRYEVSNFARPGQECAHNLAYWRQEDWLAAGPSASGHLGGWRWKNAPRLDDYLRTDDGGFAPVTDAEAPDARRALGERLMTGLRLREGLDQDSVDSAARAIDPALPARLRALLLGFVAEGLLIEADTRWTPTNAGVMRADGMAADALSLVLGG